MVEDFEMKSNKAIGDVSNRSLGGKFPSRQR